MLNEFVLLALLPIGIVIGVFAGIFFCCNKKTTNNENNGNANVTVTVDDNKSTTTTKTESTMTDITIGHLIGIGRFGAVYKGTWMQSTQVACKKVQSSEYGTNQEEFTQEIETLSVLNHPNIVKYYGQYVDEKGDRYMVTEFMALGSLETLVRESNVTYTSSQVYKIAKQIAAGMVYLHSAKWIHRDLALRSVLVANNNFDVKLSNLGLARRMNQDGTYSSKKNRCTVKWTAPEALVYDGKFSAASDVWSFGVCLWELFSKGEQPYQTIAQSQLAEKLKAGVRLTPPDGTPQPIIEIMNKCWQQDPAQRPTFTDLYSQIASLLD